MFKRTTVTIISLSSIKFAGTPNLQCPRRRSTSTCSDSRKLLLVKDLVPKYKPNLRRGGLVEDSSKSVGDKRDDRGRRTE